MLLYFLWFWGGCSLFILGSLVYYGELKVYSGRDPLEYAGAVVMIILAPIVIATIIYDYISRRIKLRRKQ